MGTWEAVPNLCPSRYGLTRTRIWLRDCNVYGWPGKGWCNESAWDMQGTWVLVESPPLREDAAGAGWQNHADQLTLVQHVEDDQTFHVGRGHTAMVTALRVTEAWPILLSDRQSGALNMIGWVSRHFSSMPGITLPSIWVAHCTSSYHAPWPLPPAFFFISARVMCFSKCLVAHKAK